MKPVKQARRDAKQLFRLCLVNGLLDGERVRQVVRHLCETSNRNRLNVLAAFRRLVKLDCARRAATVESATPLPPALKARVQAELSRAYGLGVEPTFIHNPALIGECAFKLVATYTTAV